MEFFTNYTDFFTIYIVFLMNKQSFQHDNKMTVSKKVNRVIVYIKC